MACENVARVVKMKIKTEKSDCNILSEIFGNFQFFVEKKNFSPSLQKSPNLKKSQNPSTKISIPQQKSQSIYLVSFHYNLIQLHCSNISRQPHCLSLKNPPSPKSKNYRKTLINYRIPITKMLQFCPGFGASLLQALKDSHFLPLSLASDAISHSLCTLTPPCV